MDIHSLSILLVDDDEDDYVILRDLLNEIKAWRPVLEWVQTYDAGLSKISDHAHEVYLFDYRLGKHTGLELLRHARARECRAPMILLTGQGDHEIDMEAMKLGAADYLIKGKIDAALLERSIRHALERKRMEAAMRQSEKLSAVGQLAAGVAHEINNPLGVILGFAQSLIRRVAAGDPIESPLKSIERETIRCKHLVQNLLTFSRSTQGAREPTQLNQVVEGALPLIQAEAKIANVRVVADLAGELPPVLANANQLQQVIINLANNAIDAMPDGGTVTIKTLTAQEGPRAWATVWVSDTGNGIPREILPRIFEPFFTTKPIGKGTGLGLSLAYEIIQKHDGAIEVESRPGSTVFSIRLPVHKSSQPSDAGRVVSAASRGRA